MAAQEQTARDQDVDGEGGLGERYEKVTLEDDEEASLEILETETDNNPGTDVDLRWAAVGRFLADKSIKVEVMQQVLASVWCPVKGVYLKVLENNLFIFQFFHEKDIQRILCEGPWAFENATLVLKKLNDGDQSAVVELNRVDFWIQVHDVPCGLMTKGVAEQIGNSLGVFVENDPNNFGGNWRSYMRIRVGLDTNQPLRRRLKLRKKGGNWAWVTFNYERLYTFCYYCGLLGHSEKFCAKAIDSDTTPSKFGYDPWLRAPVRRFFTPVGDRWLVKEGLLEGAGMNSESPSGGDLEATTLRVPPTTAGGNEEVNQNYMEVDGEEVTV